MLRRLTWAVLASAAIVIMAVYAGSALADSAFGLRGLHDRRGPVRGHRRLEPLRDAQHSPTERLAVVSEIERIV